MVSIVIYFYSKCANFGVKNLISCKIFGKFSGSVNLRETIIYNFEF